MAKNKLCLILEESLCETIHYHAVIFDKSCKGYKEINAVTNAWEKMANSLECIRGGTYQSLF